MNIIYKPRQSGKTLELIKRHDNYDGYIVVRSRKEANRVKAKAEELGYKINLPMTYYDITGERAYGLKASKISIDDLDIFLAWLIQNTVVENITLTDYSNEESKEPEPVEDITFQYYGRDIVVTKEVIQLMSLLDYEFGQRDYVVNATEFQLRHKDLFVMLDINSVGYYLVNVETNYAIEVTNHNFMNGKYYNPFITDWNWLIKICEILDVKILDFNIENVYDEVLKKL